MQGFSEDIILPHCQRVGFKFVAHVAYQIFTLPFRSHKRRDFGSDIGTNNMQCWCTSFEPYAEASAFFGEFRFFQDHFFHGWNHHTIAFFLYIIQSMLQLIVFFFCKGKLFSIGQYVVQTGDFYPTHFLIHSVEQIIFCCHFNTGYPIGQIHMVQYNIFDKIIRS